MGSYGIEPMCRVLRIAPSTWHEHARRKADPDLRSKRAKVDERLSEEILRVHRQNFGVYGARKVWLQLNREGFKVGRDRVARLRAQPKVSVLVPTFNTQESWLIRCIESVVEQVYSNWELCIADDASTAAHVRPLLERYAAQDPRIKVRFREENGHISKASNTALGLATGEYVALLDHDDELHPLALLECVEAF